MPGRNVWKVASVWLNTERKKHIFFKESWGSVACLLPWRKPLFMLANLSPLPNQCLKKRDVWMLSELYAQLEGVLFLDQGPPLNSPRDVNEIFTCFFFFFLSLCFSLKGGLTEAVRKIRWDVFIIFLWGATMAGDPPLTWVIPWSRSHTVGDSVQGLARREWEAWQVSAGHRAFLDKTRHLGPSKAWGCTSRIPPKGGAQQCCWMDAVAAKVLLDVAASPYTFG